MLLFGIFCTIWVFWAFYNVLLQIRFVIIYALKPCSCKKVVFFRFCSSQLTPQEWTVYLHWFCTVKHLPNPQTTSSTQPILLFQGITEPFVLGGEMTEPGGLVRRLMSRSQHVSLSRLELLEVTKGTIVPFNPSAFSAKECLPLSLCQDMFGNIPTHNIFSKVMPANKCFTNYESYKEVSAKRK